MKYEELPDIPQIWADFAAGLLSELWLQPALWDVQALRAQADKVKAREYRRTNLSRILADGATSDSTRTIESIHKLRQPETVTIVTRIQAGLFGGPASQFLKCLTAIKVCQELTKHAIAAVPVCWISTVPSEDFSNWTVSLLDHEGELHQLRLRPENTEFSMVDPLPRREITELLAQIEELGHGMFDTEIVEILRAAYVPGISISGATARLVSALMEEWGMIVLDPHAPGIRPVMSETLAVLGNRADRIDALIRERAASLATAGYIEQSPASFLPDFLQQSCVLPVTATVIDPCELHTFIKALPVFSDLGISPPMGWPRSGVTIMDARSRRTLEKYHLRVDELFPGEREVVEKIKNVMPHLAPEKLQGLVSEVKWRMAELGTRFTAENKILMTKDSCKEKMIYQMERLKDRYEAAGKRREQAMNRQIHRACNYLAPNGLTQERGLSGIQFLLRYSRALLRILYDKLDILKFEHQLIPMD